MHEELASLTPILLVLFVFNMIYYNVIQLTNTNINSFFYNPTFKFDQSFDIEILFLSYKFNILY